MAELLSKSNQVTEKLNLQEIYVNKFFILMQKSIWNISKNKWGNKILSRNCSNWG